MLKWSCPVLLTPTGHAPFLKTRYWSCHVFLPRLFDPRFLPLLFDPRFYHNYSVHVLFTTILLLSDPTVFLPPRFSLLPLLDPRFFFTTTCCFYYRCWTHVVFHRYGRCPAAIFCEASACRTACRSSSHLSGKRRPHCGQTNAQPRW